MNKVKKYVKKPVEIEAIKLDLQGKKTVILFGDIYHVYTAYGGEAFIEIETFEGKMRALNGYYLIRGVMNEIYPCKPEIFKKSYDLQQETK